MHEFARLFHRYEHFSLFEFSLIYLELSSASELIQPVLIIWIGLNLNYDRLMKSSGYEPG